MLLRERLRAVLIAAVHGDELAAAGHGHRRRDLDVWMLARADDAPSERHGFSSVARVLEPQGRLSHAQDLVGPLHRPGTFTSGSGPSISPFMTGCWLPPTARDLAVTCTLTCSYSSRGEMMPSRFRS